MKVSSPVGEYDYEVRSVRLNGGTIEVVGALGQWETTMRVEPSDWLELGRRATPVLAVAALGVALLRRM